MKTVLDQNDNKDIEKLLLGRRVITVIGGDTLVLDNGVQIEVQPNEGCGGCASGRYELDELNSCEAVITSVRTDDDVANAGHWEDRHAYKIFVLAANKEQVLLSVSGDDGNGYYGTGYQLRVTIP